MEKKRIKSAIPIYGCAALWLLAGLILPRALLKARFILVMLALNVGVYLVLSKLFPGHVVQVRTRADSGNAEINRMIEAGRSRLDKLRDADAAIADESVSQCLARMARAGEAIFDVLERDTKQANAVRRFMNYYLPTAEKLMDSYRELMRAGRGEHVSAGMRSVEGSLGMIADAFEKQLDNLYKDRTLDIETDIQVLETVMASEGLTAAQAKKI